MEKGFLTPKISPLVFHRGNPPFLLHKVPGPFSPETKCPVFIFLGEPKGLSGFILSEPRGFEGEGGFFSPTLPRTKSPNPIFGVRFPPLSSGNPKRRRVLKGSFRFGGSNHAILPEKGTPHHNPWWVQPKISFAKICPHRVKMYLSSCDRFSPPGASQWKKVPFFKAGNHPF